MDDIYIDSKTSYETLISIEKRLTGDQFEDFAEGIYGVTWPFLTNKLVIPKLRQTGRISEEESNLLSQISNRRKVSPTLGKDGVDLYPDIYELLLTLYSVYGSRLSFAFRGHSDYRYDLKPTIFRGNPSLEDVNKRLNVTFDFITRISYLDYAYRIRSKSPDTTDFMELLGVARHYGCPVHLLDFSTDIITAAFFAKDKAKADEIGEILHLQVDNYKRFTGGGNNPYGAFFLKSAPDNRIVRQRGFFIGCYNPFILENKYTGIIQKIRFKQDGLPFSSCGGYGYEDIYGGENEELKKIMDSKYTNKAEPHPQLQKHFDIYRKLIHKEYHENLKEVEDEQYLRTCNILVKQSLPENPTEIEIRIAEFFVQFQYEIWKSPVVDHLKYVSRPRSALETYLILSGSPEENVLQAIRTAWYNPSIKDRKTVVSIYERMLPNLEEDLNRLLS